MCPQKALSRKSSMRPERHNDEELEANESLKRFLVKGIFFLLTINSFTDGCFMCAGKKIL